MFATSMGISAVVFNLGALLWLSYASAVRWYENEPARVRVGASLVQFLWLLAFISLWLGFVGGLNLGAYLAVGAGAVALGGYLAPPTICSTAGADLRRVGDQFSYIFSGRRLFVSLPVCAAASKELLQALGSPPTGWDSLMYHLPRAAIWIQQGGFFYGAGTPEGVSIYSPPNGWWKSANSHFPFGDMVSAWVMLPVHSDLLVPIAWFSVWLAAVVSVALLAREIGASRRHAWLAAAVAGLVPALETHMALAYVDTLVVLSLLLALVFACRYEKTKSVPAAGLVLAVLGVALAIKKTAVPAAGLIGVFVLYTARQNRAIRNKAIGIGMVAAASVAGVWPLYLWLETGSPIFPYGIGWTGEGGFPVELTSLIDGAAPPGPNLDLYDYVCRLFWEGMDNRFLEQNNFGIAVPFLGLAGCLAAWRNRHQSEANKTVGLIAVTAFALLAILLTKKVYSSGWGYSAARYVAVGPVALIAVLAARDRAWVTWLFGAGFLCHLAYLFPLGIGQPQWLAGKTIALELYGVAAVSVPVFLFWRPDSPVQSIAKKGLGLAVAILAVGTVVQNARERYRYPVYRCLAANECFSNHRLGNLSRAAMPLAEAIDDPTEPKKIALTTARMAHSWYGYPFFGSRLQNRLYYISPNNNDDFQPLRKITREPDLRDFEIWLRRLREAGIDYVVNLGPESVESKWMDELSNHFELVEKGPKGKNRIYRVQSVN